MKSKSQKTEADSKPMRPAEEEEGYKSPPPSSMDAEGGGYGSPSSSTTRRRSISATLPNHATFDYAGLANEIVANLKIQEFDTMIFDFDGTLTKSHTARVTPREIDASKSWFADKEILEEILKKGCEQGIRFLIASHQAQEIIERILKHHNLKDFFDVIHGAGRDSLTKSEFINRIAEDESRKKILYLDDDPEEIIIKKITMITGLLPTLSPTRRARRDIDGEAGLTLEKWQQVSTCLQTGNYKIISESRQIEEFVTSPPFASSSLLFEKEDDTENKSSPTKSSYFHQQLIESAEETWESKRTGGKRSRERGCKSLF